MAAVTLANGIIGVGVLAMPYCFSQCGVLLSALLIAAGGLASRSASHLLLKSAAKSRRRSFEALAFCVFGEAGKLLVEVGTVGFTAGTCVAYMVVVGDLGPQIVAKALDVDAGEALRTIVMVVVSVACVLPLGLLKNVHSLSGVCAATVGFYFCLVIKIMAEATEQILQGDWIHKVEMWRPAGVLQCLPIFSMSLFCQTQLFEIYDTLPNASLEKMNSVTKDAVTICSIVYILVGTFGYIAFCNQAISGNILTNLSPTIASDIIKIGFVLSLAFSFPLIIFPCRASLYSLLYKKGQVSSYDLLNNMIPEFKFKCLTVSIIGVTLVISLMLPNIELVLGFIGSTVGVMICVIFPAICFICITVKNTNERILAQIVMFFGIIVMVLGTYANLQAAEIENIKSTYKAINNHKIEHDSYRAESAMFTSNYEKKELNEVIKNNFEKIEDLNIRERRIKSEMEKKRSNLKKANDQPTVKKEEKKDTINKEETVPIRLSRDEKNIGVMKNEILKDDDKVKEDDKKNDKGKEDDKEDDKGKEDDKVKEDDKLELKKIQLIDTIKKHEEEQRQIINEQKQILKEMKKTKQEIEKDNLIKNIDVSLANSNDKKIAVENIQKLAKLAIESLGGKLDIVTERILNKSNVGIRNEENQSVKEKNKEITTVSQALIQKDDAEINLNKVDTSADIKKNKSLNASLEKNILPIPQNLNKVEGNRSPKNVPPVSRDMDKNKESNINAVQNDIKVETVKKDSVRSDYLGVKRDILEIRGDI